MFDKNDLQHIHEMNIFDEKLLLLMLFIRWSVYFLMQCKLRLRAFSVFQLVLIYQNATETTLL